MATAMMYSSFATATTPTAMAASPMTIQSMVIMNMIFFGSLGISANLLLNKIANGLQGFCLSLFQIVVDNHYIEFFGIAQLEGRFCQTAFDNFGRVGTTTGQSLAELFE